MGFGGHVLYMIKTINGNRAMMPSRNKKSKESKGFGSTSAENGNEPLKFKEVSELELKRIKKAIQKKSRERRIRDVILLSILGVLVLLTSWWLMGEV